MLHTYKVSLTLCDCLTNDLLKMVCVLWRAINMIVTCRSIKYASELTSIKKLHLTNEMINRISIVLTISYMPAKF